MPTSDQDSNALLALDRLEKLSKITAAIAIPVVLAIGGWIFQAQSQNSKLSHDYVKLAVDILRADKDENDEPLRTWAVDLLNEYSEVKFLDDARESLISGETTLPKPTTIGESPKIPEYDLSPPISKVILSSVQKNIIDAALGEINADIHEMVSYERIGKYWQLLGLEYDGQDRDMPWGAAFVSWVIDQSGNPNKVPLSPTADKIWYDSVGKGLTFLPSKKMPVPGDFVFFLLGRNEQGIQLIRTGKTKTFKSHSGVVYESSDKGFTSIEGNLNNGIRLREHTYDDNSLIGFVRFKG